MDQIRKYITDSRLENLIDTYRGKFEKTEDASSQMLEDCGIHEKEPSMMAEALLLDQYGDENDAGPGQQPGGKNHDGRMQYGNSVCGKFLNQYDQATKESRGWQKNCCRRRRLYGKTKRLRLPTPIRCVEP